jgi:hypothetical protein
VSLAITSPAFAGISEEGLFDFTGTENAVFRLKKGLSARIRRDPHFYAFLKTTDRALVPEALAAKLQGAKTPLTVRAWIAQAPAWFEIRPNPPFDSALRFLDAGERAAIALTGFGPSPQAQDRVRNAAERPGHVSRPAGSL